MKSRISFIFILSSILILSGPICMYGQKKVSKMSDGGNFRSPFRYIIIDNKIDPAVSRTDESARFLEILVAPKEFSKDNLILLFKMLSKRFPKPTVLYATVYTDLEDVETPEERERGLISGSSGSSLGPNQQDTALFLRLPKRRNIQINFANGDLQEIELP